MQSWVWDQKCQGDGCSWCTLNLFTRFPDSCTCALEEIQSVSPPSSTSLVPRFCRARTWVRSSYLVHSFINSFSQCLLSKNMCWKLCLCVCKRFWHVDSKSFCDLIRCFLRKWDSDGWIIRSSYLGEHKPFLGWDLSALPDTVNGLFPRLMDAPLEALEA